MGRIAYNCAQVPVPSGIIRGRASTGLVKTKTMHRLHHIRLFDSLGRSDRDLPISIDRVAAAHETARNYLQNIAGGYMSYMVTT